MKWKKLGKIFDPIEHKLPNGCFEFAQSPQTLVFNDFVRIYFSTRKIDPKNGKSISHIAFVDMDKDFKKILNISQQPVIELGGLGCFDEHGIFPINVLRDDDKIIAYTCGWSRRLGVSAEASIGYAVSYDNGLTFKKFGTGPILTSSINEPFLLGDAFVQRYNNIYHMWYIYGTKWIKDESRSIEPERVYKIGHATSYDGINWKKDGRQLISNKLNEDECQALPTVIYHNSKFHMLFCYRDAFNFRNDKSKAYRIGYAHSDNLVDWTRDDENVGIDVSYGLWDSDMLCYPHIFECSNNIYLLYNGNQFGRYGFGLAILEN